MNNATPNKGQELIEEIILFLQKKDLEPELLSTKPACRFFYTHESVQYKCYIMIEQEISMIRFYFIPPVSIEHDFLLPISEFIARANYGMIFGNFEMDFSDGEIRYKKIIEWRKTFVEMNEIAAVLESGVTVWGNYFPILKSILDNGTTPKEAISWL